MKLAAAVGRVRSAQLICAAILLLCPAVTLTQSARQTQADSYTRYDLLDPATQSFRIYYDVSATSAGAQYYFNTLRAGSEHTVHGVTDLMTGRPLEWEVVDGRQARTSGLPEAQADGEYLRVTLARPVPAGGEARVRIDKTYRDTASYWQDGAEIVFSRSLGINRNSVVLPQGYELIGCNYPSQVVTEPSGRIKLSFFSRGPASVPYEVKARRLATLGRGLSAPAGPRERQTGPTTTQTVSAAARVDYTFTERAFQDREIVYFLQQPETHSFRLYHDYTETRQGVDRYLNIVRQGSKASDPSASNLDTGAELAVEQLKGSAISDRGIELGQQITAETEVVVIWFEPVPSGGSTRLRIWETYTDPNRYVLAGDELVWDRAFGRPQNTVVLPDGWYLTTNSIPAVVDETDDGRVSLYYVNDRPDNIAVFIKARRR